MYNWNGTNRFCNWRCLEWTLAVMRRKERYEVRRTERSSSQPNTKCILVWDRQPTLHHILCWPIVNQKLREIVMKKREARSCPIQPLTWGDLASSMCISLHWFFPFSMRLITPKNLWIVRPLKIIEEDIYLNLC